MCSGTPSLPKWANGWICFVDKDFKFSKILPVKKIVKYSEHKTSTGEILYSRAPDRFVNSKGVDVISPGALTYHFDRKRRLVNDWQNIMHRGMRLQRQIADEIDKRKEDNFLNDYTIVATERAAELYKR